MSRRSADQLAQDFFGKALVSLAATERRVLERISRREVLAQDSSETEDEQAGFGDRLADKVAAVGGSWGFIIAFGVVLFGWMALNSGVLGRLGVNFDPYPFIFLNLMLSTLAAIQAPVIMMSQNRQGAKDRIAAQHDYEINLRAELDIIRLHQKMDRLLDKMAVIERRLDHKGS